MVLEENLSTDKGTQAQPNCKSQDRVWRREKGQDHGPREGQAFLLTEAALPVAGSSLTSTQTFLLGGEPHPSPQEGGSKRKQCSSFVWVHGREHQAWQKGLSVELGHCQTEPAGLLEVFRVAVVAGKCPAPLPGPGTQTHLVPQGVGQNSACALTVPSPTQSVPQSHSSWVPP